MTPKTAEGKMVTMVYALFGVPLMLMCLSSLGGLLAEALQCVYCRISQRNIMRNGLELQDSGARGVAGRTDKLALNDGCALRKGQQIDHERSRDEVSQISVVVPRIIFLIVSYI